LSTPRSNSTTAPQDTDSQAGSDYATPKASWQLKACVRWFALMKRRQAARGKVRTFNTQLDFTLKFKTSHSPEDYHDADFSTQDDQCMQIAKGVAAYAMEKGLVVSSIAIARKGVSMHRIGARSEDVITNDTPLLTYRVSIFIS